MEGFWRGDWLGGLQADSIVSPKACENLVTSSLKQSPGQTTSHLDSYTRCGFALNVYAKLASQYRHRVQKSASCVNVPRARNCARPASRPCRLTAAPEGSQAPAIDSPGAL